MAVATLTRSFIISKSFYSSFFMRIIQPCFLHFQPFSRSPVLFAPTAIPATLFPSQTLLSGTTSVSGKQFCTTSASSKTPISPTATTRKSNTLVNFSLSDLESDSESESTEQVSAEGKGIDKSKLPPAYDPFNKKPVIEEPEDPKNLQAVFHKIRSDGLINNAVKMFDGLSKDGLTHEALDLFSQIKDKGQMPDVVAHTAVIEAYANAGQPKEALKVFMRMLASGVLPNAYTYTVLIKGLVESGDKRLVKEAKNYVVEMVEKRGIKPNAGICLGVYEGLVKVGLEEEGMEVLEILKSKGVVPEEKKVREALKHKRGPVYRTVMDVLYGK